MQLEHTHMAMLLHHLRTIPRFVPGQMIVQARVDAWHVSCPRLVAKEVQERLGSLTLGQLHDTSNALSLHSRSP